VQISGVGVTRQLVGSEKREKLFPACM